MKQGHVDVVRVLLEAKADFNIPYKGTGSKPLFIAAQNVRCWLAFCTDTSVNAPIILLGPC